MAPEVVIVSLWRVAVVVKTVLGSHFWGVFGAPPILEPILVIGLGCESWGYDVDFDPQPCVGMGPGHPVHVGCVDLLFGWLKNERVG